MANQLDGPAWSVCDIFSQALPEFLAIGMPYELFWEGHVWLAPAFRKAHRARRKQANFDAWLQATYVYEAFATVLGNAFSGGKGREWLTEPYDLYPSRRDPEHNIDRESKPPKGEMAGKAFMESFMVRHNAARAQRAAMGVEGTELGVNDQAR